VGYVFEDYSAIGHKNGELQKMHSMRSLTALKNISTAKMLVLGSSSVQQAKQGVKQTNHKLTGGSFCFVSKAGTGLYMCSDIGES
jgi:hypothetical protein